MNILQYSINMKHNLSFWTKCLVHLNIGMAVGVIAMLVWREKWELMPGWIAALPWAIGWRIEMHFHDIDANDATY